MWESNLQKDFNHQRKKKKKDKLLWIQLGACHLNLGLWNENECEGEKREISLCKAWISSSTALRPSSGKWHYGGKRISSLLYPFWYSCHTILEPWVLGGWDKWEAETGAWNTEGYTWENNENIPVTGEKLTAVCWRSWIFGSASGISKGMWMPWKAESSRPNHGNF